MTKQSPWGAGQHLGRSGSGRRDRRASGPGTAASPGQRPPQDQRGNEPWPLEKEAGREVGAGLLGLRLRPANSSRWSSAKRSKAHSAPPAETLGTGLVREEAALGSPALRSERTGALLGTLTCPGFWNTNVFITEEMLLL